MTAPDPASGGCTCANDGHASNCTFHTQDDFDAADRAIGRPSSGGLTEAQRDARLYAWLANVSPGDIVTVRLNSTDTLTGKVYEAPDDSHRIALYVNTTLLRYGNGYPGGSFEPMTPNVSDTICPNCDADLLQHCSACGWVS